MWRWVVLSAAWVGAAALDGWACEGESLKDICEVGAEECHGLCEATDGCAAWVHDKGEGCCKMKAECFVMIPKEGVLSGTLDHQHMWDADCPGEDIFVNGVYTKKCEVTLDQCVERCKQTPGCTAAVHNYPETPSGDKGQWTDGCCWLKKSCKAPKKMDGKHAVLFTNTALQHVWDADCPGEDIFVNGVYTKKCDVTLDECTQRCKQTPGCAAAVHNYPETPSGEKGQWTDGCCWLKKSCTAPKKMEGKHAILFPSPTPESAVPEAKPKTEKLEKNAYGPVQLAEFILVPELDKANVKSVTCQRGESPKGEGPDALFDGDKHTKWVDFMHAPVTLSLHEPVTVEAYALVTGNDNPGRDPVRWKVFASVDGTEWKELSAPAEGVPEERLKLTEEYKVQPAVWSWLRFEVVQARGAPGDVKRDVPVNPQVIRNIACEGNDLVVNGYYQRACNIDEALCTLVCSRTLHCTVFTYEPETQCCALKSQCSDHRELYGRDLHVMRQTYIPASHPGHLSPVDTLKEALNQADLKDIGEVLELLSEEYSTEEVMKVALEWLEQQKEEEPEADVEEPRERAMPWFALPRKQTPRDLAVMLQELELPKRN